MRSEIQRPKPGVAKVLLIEDDPEDALLLREMLAEGGGTRFDLECTDKLQTGLERLSRGKTDVLLLDLSLPDSIGLETVHKVHAHATGVPIVVLTGLNDEALAIKAVRQGAQDYLVKGQVDGNLLVRSIRYAIERHRLLIELETARQEQLQLKDQFLSHVSHELRSPLTSIHQFVTLLLDGLVGDLSPEQRECMEIALRNADQLGSMIGELLEATRVETGKLTVDFQCISMPEVIVETLRAFRATAAAKGVVLSGGVPKDLPPAYADPDRVRQILTNLIDNAIKFTAENGRITVRAQVFDQEPEFLSIAVADTGCGIPPENIERIFDRLFQKKSDTNGGHDGLGLGLYICKELVSHHGGRIWAESTPGHGSTFFFTLPIFSVSRLLAPILVPKNLLSKSVALITVELFSCESRLLTKSDEILLREVRNVLRHCILPDKDVLLPRMARMESGEILFIVACTDKAGVEVIVRRIREQLANCKDLQDSQFVLSTSFAMVDIPPEKKNVPLEQIVDDLASTIENIVRGKMLHKKED